MPAPITCRCGQQLDDADPHCPECGRPRSDAVTWKARRRLFSVGCHATFAAYRKGERRPAALKTIARKAIAKAWKEPDHPDRYFVLEEVSTAVSAFTITNKGEHNLTWLNKQRNRGMYRAVQLRSRKENRQHNLTFPLFDKGLRGDAAHKLLADNGLDISRATVFRDLRDWREQEAFNRRKIVPYTRFKEAKSDTRK